MHWPRDDCNLSNHGAAVTTWLWGVNLSSPQALAQVVLLRTHDALIRGARGADGAVFLRIGKECDNATVVGSDLSRSRQPFVLEEGIANNVLHAGANPLPSGRD
jgi:hypothetical protein